MKLRLAFLCSLFCVPLTAMAAVPSAPLWQIIPEKSHLTFTATQNNAPVEGEFSQFTAVIHFAADQLPTSSVTADIMLGSVQTSYDDIAKTVIGDEWFAVAKFPKATFESHQFKHLGDNRYEAAGTLTLRGVALPVTLPFTITHSSAGTIGISGETTLKRTAFGVGQGEWASTSSVGDEVKVKLVIEAKN
jgi:polyisoprenoid-binding protein YceI